MTAPSEFDWVRAKRECSLADMFALLRRQAEQDTASRNAIRAEDEAIKFECKVRGADEFVVSREGEPSGRVEFARKNGHIQILNHQTHRLTIALSDDGHCVFVLSGRERQPWQVTRAVLEGLFFPPVKAPATATAKRSDTPRD
jgi:hypothetical protein